MTRQPVDKRNTAMVFQNYALWPHMTIYQNVEFGPKMKGLDSGKRRAMAEDKLQLVELTGLGKRKPNQLSGGQQQRVALARALAAEADCLLLDEPLSNLDAKLRMHMRHELRELVKTSGATAVYVTHDQKEALSMADRIAVMHAGRIVQIGTPEDVYNRPATKFVAGFIGEANFLPGKVASDGKVETPAGRLASTIGVPEGATDVTCCVRPEWVDIVAADTPANGKNAIPAEIETDMYLGEIRQFFCKLPEGSVWRISTLGQQTAPFRAGDKVALHVDASDLVVLAE